jgi:hypothetical protein
MGVFQLCGGVGTRFRSLLQACCELQLFVDTTALLGAKIYE